MSFPYADLIAVADELIPAAGRDVILRVASKTPADSDKPWGSVEPNATATDDQTITVKAVFVAPEEEDKAASTTRKRRERVKIAPTALGSLVITDAWQLVDGTTVYEIVRVSPVRPGTPLVVLDLLLEV